MSLGPAFKNFCANLSVKNRSLISDRCGLITRRLNLKFRDNGSQNNNKFFTGSYGRDTASCMNSDLDLIVKLPLSYYTRYRNCKGNGPSLLLQSVRNGLLETYPSTAIRADGQIVSVAFTDGMTIEVLPAFEQSDKSFIYPDANDGGSWKTTRPRFEIDAINQLEKKCNGNLKNLCKIARAWRERHSVPIKGLLIDTLAYNFMQSYEKKDCSFDAYDILSFDFFQFLSEQNPSQKYWFSPGANQRVYRIGLFEHKAKQAKQLILKIWDQLKLGRESTAKKLCRTIYGSDFPTT